MKSSIFSADCPVITHNHPPTTGKMSPSATTEVTIDMENIPPRQTRSKPTEEEKHRKAWKYFGYRKYAKFISSDNDFLILRRFDTLSARVALTLQDEVALVEEELDALDILCRKPESGDVNNGTLREDPIPDRTRLLILAAEKLHKYNEFLLQHATLKKLAVAPKRDIDSLHNWHYNHGGGAISEKEQTYLDKPDLVRVVHEERTPLRRAIDSSIRLRTLPIWKVKSKHPSEPETDDEEEVSLYSDKRIDRFASSVICFIGVTMLIVPIWILQMLGTLQMKLGVITIFISTFLLLVSFAMVAKPFEALGATAAYAAVLMVFIQFGTVT